MVLREDRSLLAVAHISQLLDLITVVGGFIVPLLLWLTQKDKVYAMDVHGKAILNFQLSMFVYSIICIPLILLFGLGILGFIIIGVAAVVFPVINAIKASNGEEPNYPLNIRFIK